MFVVFYDKSTWSFLVSIAPLLPSFLEASLLVAPMHNNVHLAPLPRWVPVLLLPERERRDREIWGGVDGDEEKEGREDWDGGGTAEGGNNIKNPQSLSVQRNSPLTNNFVSCSLLLGKVGVSIS